MKTLIVIEGPTGVGKTDLSINLAKAFNTEIISCDSRQFFKELRIGTAVPEPEQLEAVKHHFIQNLSIQDYYNAAKFEVDALERLKEIFKYKDVCLMVGGSGLYIDAVCRGIDMIPDITPELRNELINRLNTEGIESLRFELKKLDPVYYEEVDLKNKQRVLRALEVCYTSGKPFSSFRTGDSKKRSFEIVKIALNRDRDELYERINKRVDMMLDEGLIDEAKSVYKYKGAVPLKTVGYRELFDYFEGITDKAEAVRLIKRNTRHYAKRQINWFSRDEKTAWYNPNQEEEILNYLNK